VLSKESGAASLTYVKAAIEAVKSGIGDCLVTAPVNKKAISLNNIPFIGHTEYLAEAFGVEDVVMMFVSEN